MTPTAKLGRTWAQLASALGGAPEATPTAAPQGSLGRYVVTGEIGLGGMGRVLSAIDPEIGREVAIKVLRQELGLAPSDLGRFVAEARLTGQLEHPGVVPVYDVGVSEEGQVFLVMKKVEGRPLSLAIQEGDLSTARMLSAFVDVCEAVAFAHDRGVVHQDLKPDNILIGAFGEVLVVDWGIAAVWSAARRLSPDLAAALRGGDHVSGSPGYIAPERLEDPQAPPRPRSDQWSLGGVLYAILSGQRPYPGGLDEVLVATLRGPPQDVRLRDPDRDVPDEIADVAMRALAADPADRFSDVAALADAVRGYLEGRDRRARALTQVARADGLRPAIEARFQAATELRARAQALCSALVPSSPLEQKEPAWELEDAAAREEQQARLDEIVWLQTLRGALNLVSDLPEAHRRLADHYRAEHQAAERRRDPDAATASEWLLRQHDRGRHRAYLAGTGALTLVTDPPGAEVRLHRYVERRRRLVAEPVGLLGTSPLLAVPLDLGSYLLTLHRDGHEVVRYPVYIERQACWDGIRPGESKPLPIHLPRLGELSEEEVYVPAGWFIAGGDPLAPDGLSRRRVWVDGFVMRRHPVTQGEYLSFLNDLVTHGRVEESDRLVPRDKTHPSHPRDGDPMFTRRADGSWGPPGEVDPETWARTPVVRLDLARALAFAATRPGWRLADELEREKATRGVDGRFFPWGDHHDPALHNMFASHGLPRRVPVEDFPLDLSVYGVSGLGGNVRDLCGNRWTEDGPARDGERLVHRPAGLDVDYISARGGAWSDAVQLTRAAARFGDRVKVCLDTRGLRLVRLIGARAEITLST